MRSKIRSFIQSNFYVPDPAALPDEGSLLEAGVIDSTGVLELIGFLQDEFRIVVTDDETIPDNLDSIAKIEAYVTRKLAAPSAAPQA